MPVPRGDAKAVTKFYPKSGVLPVNARRRFVEEKSESIRPPTGGPGRWAFRGLVAPTRSDGDGRGGRAGPERSGSAAMCASSWPRGAWGTPLRERRARHHRGASAM